MFKKIPNPSSKKVCQRFYWNSESLYKCLKFDSKPNVCWDLIRFEFWKVDESVHWFILDRTDTSLIWGSNRKRGNIDIVKPIKESKCQILDWKLNFGHTFVVVTRSKTKMNETKCDKQLANHLIFTSVFRISQKGFWPQVSLFRSISWNF